jgi:ribonuclease E
MIKKIIVSHLNNIAAVVQHNKVQELIVINDTYQVNDIYMGTVQKIFTSINAAFIKLNYFDKSGFIHVNDVKTYSSLKNIRGISDIIKVQQKLLVQITKEPTSNKGPRLTTNIHLSGTYLILMPFNNTVCIAHKIYDENERSFLRALGILIKPPTMGIIFKESSAGLEEKILIEDLTKLRQQWSFIQKAAINKDSSSLLYKDNNIITKILRDYYSKDVKTIIIDSKDGFKQVYEQLKLHQINKKISKISLELYQQKICILKRFRINKLILDSVKPKVELQMGIYLFIESLEALTIIDVNSGSFNQSRNSQDSLLRANCLAATEIAYQLKIRNISGIIIIDFIDMKAYKDKLKLLEHFSKVLKTDDSKPEIVQLSELGLVELTRRRRGKSLPEIFTNPRQKIPTENPCIQLNINKRIQYETESLIVNVNSIFFKKEFRRHLYLNVINNICQEPEMQKIILIPLTYSYVIPLNLYYSELL